MLRVIAESQRSVRKEFLVLAGIQPQIGGFKDVVDDLLEMDKGVELIETSVSQVAVSTYARPAHLLTIFSVHQVNRTLTLQQNATAIAQADAAVYQGRIILLFTVVTIVFVRLFTIFPFLSHYWLCFALTAEADSSCSSPCHTLRRCSQCKLTRSSRLRPGHSASCVGQFLLHPRILLLIQDRVVGASSLISVTLAVYAFYSDNANALVRRSWERLEGIHRSSKEAEGGSDAGGDEEDRADDRPTSALLDCFWELKGYLRLYINKGSWFRASDKVHARVFQWYARLLAFWRFRPNPDATLPRAESTTSSGPTDSIERRSEELRRLSLGMRLTPWAHDVREWLMARRRRRAHNEYPASPAPRPSTTSRQRQPQFW